MVSAINSALSGLNAASTQLTTSANNIANVTTQDPQPQDIVQNSQAGAQGNDITNDLVNTDIASYDFQANLKTIQVANQTLQSFLDIIS